jgi:hypothetical protein
MPADTPPLRSEITSFTLFDGPYCPALPAGVRHIAEFIPLVRYRYGLPLDQDRVVANERKDSFDDPIVCRQSTFSG